jgi:hypothetical protein
MAEKLSNEQKHQRSWCAFTHIRIAWIFVGFCAVEVFLSWKDLDKPISRPNLVELPFYILIVLVYAPIFWMVLRCFAERFVIGIAAAHMAISIVSWSVPSLFVASLYNPMTVLVRRTFFGLWIVAFFLSLRMPLQSARHPYVELDEVPSGRGKPRWLILCAVMATAIVLGALLYFVPLP